MNSMRLQRGVGLVEVLVALLLLSIGVLGFAALQIRAVDASQAAGSQVTAIGVASDLADRMRTNIPAVWAGNYTQTAPIACATAKSFISSTTTIGGSAQSQATYDLNDVSDKACQAGMTAVVVDLCPASVTALAANSNVATRQCVYVSWGKTTLTSKADCVTSTGAYKSGAQCLFLEAY